MPEKNAAHNGPDEHEKVLHRVHNFDQQRFEETMFPAEHHGEKKRHDKSELDKGVDEEPVVER